MKVMVVKFDGRILNFSSVAKARRATRIKVGTKPVVKIIFGKKVRVYYE